MAYGCEPYGLRERKGPLVPVKSSALQHTLAASPLTQANRQVNRQAASQAEWDPDRPSSRQAGL